MKKLVAIWLTLALCLTFTACGKTQAVKDVEAAIKAIGSVSMDSEEAITKAERMYNFLTDEEKSKVGNKSELVEARHTYETLYEEEVYVLAKEAYELLGDTAELYLYDARNMYWAGQFGELEKMWTTDSDFCKKFAESTFGDSKYPQLTEQEVKAAVTGYCEENGLSESQRADKIFCMNLYFYAFAHVRNYSTKDMMEKAGTILENLKDSYQDDKYYPELVAYRDFVATGSALTLNSSVLNDIPIGIRAYQTEKSQYEQKIGPMFVR